LASTVFAEKNPAYERWISLDFLGFPRAKWAFSIGYADFSLKNISRALSAAETTITGQVWPLIQTGRMAHASTIT
jgi:hypothetical protein